MPQEKLDRFQSKDPREVLGVSSNASEEEIKQARRELAHKYHPEKHIGEPESTVELMGEIMAKIDRAYAALTKGPANRGQHNYKTETKEQPQTRYQEQNPFAQEKTNVKEERFTTTDTRTRSSRYSEQVRPVYDVVKREDANVKETTNMEAHAYPGNWWRTDDEQYNYFGRTAYDKYKKQHFSDRVEEHKYLYEKFGTELGRESKFYKIHALELEPERNKYGGVDSMVDYIKTAGGQNDLWIFWEEGGKAGLYKGDLLDDAKIDYPGESDPWRHPKLLKVYPSIDEALEDANNQPYSDDFSLTDKLSSLFVGTPKMLKKKMEEVKEKHAGTLILRFGYGNSFWDGGVKQSVTSRKQPEMSQSERITQQRKSQGQSDITRIRMPKEPIQIEDNKPQTSKKIEHEITRIRLPHK